MLISLWWMENRWKDIRTWTGLNDHILLFPWAYERALERPGEMRGQARREG